MAQLTNPAPGNTQGPDEGGWPVSQALEAISRLRSAVELMASLDSVGAMVSVSDLALLLASHDALETALEKANKPRWFYVHDDEDASPFDCAYDAVESFLGEGNWDGLAGQSEVIQIQTGRLCADIWVAARVFSEEEREARDDGEWFEFTEHASRAEAEAALKGAIDGLRAEIENAAEIDQ